MKIERLCANDYDELLDFLNRAFGYISDDGFAQLLPAMWQRDDEHMNKHLCIRDNGKIRSVVGIYPLNVHIAGHSLTFATCGNIGTERESRGKGYMKTLMTAAMEELNRLNIDVARLGGQRQRYERYGFETVGTTLNYLLNTKNLTESHSHNDIRNDLVFKKINRDDVSTLEFASSLHKSEPFYTERGSSTNYYDVMSAWKSIPYIAYLPDGNPAGVIVVSSKNDVIAEQYAKTPELKYSMLASWMNNNKLSAINFNVPCWDKSFNRIVGADCEEVIIKGSTMCKIINWDKLANALLDLSFTDTNTPYGQFVLEIKGYGRLCFEGKKCRITDKSPDMTLDTLNAARLLFGFGMSQNICEIPGEKHNYITSLLPLPMSWNGQDRV